LTSGEWGFVLAWLQGKTIHGVFGGLILWISGVMSEDKGMDGHQCIDTSKVVT
jgi:hypothetical protein